MISISVHSTSGLSWPITSFPGAPVWAGSGGTSGINERPVLSVGMHLGLSATFGTFASVFFAGCDFLEGEGCWLGAREGGVGVGVSVGVDASVCGLLAALCKDSSGLTFEAGCLEGRTAAGVTVGGALSAAGRGATDGGGGGGAAIAG